MQNIIKKAQKNKKTVRAIGTAHSWTDILCTDGYLINTDKVNKVLSIDTEKKQIRVQAGIKLKDLINVLTFHNLALPNQPAVTVQSIAGVMSTATHGSGHTGTMADFITNIELLAADGSLYELSKDQHPNWFAAARVNIGSLGIIYAVTIQCVPIFKLKHEQYQTSWKTIQKSYQQLNKENKFFSFYYEVREDYVRVDIWNKTDKSVPNKFLLKTKNNLRSAYNWGYKTLATLSPRYFPQSGLLQKEQPTIEYSYEALSGEPSSPYLEEEIAIDPILLPEAIEAIKKLISEYKQKGIIIYGMICRFVQEDKDSYLSPASDKDVVFVSITSQVEKKYEPFYRDYFKLMLKFNGRPHWGKINYLNYDDAKKLYGQNFDKFLAVCKQLDPNGMFSNEFTQRVFGW